MKRRSLSTRAAQVGARLASIAIVGLLCTLVSLPSSRAQDLGELVLDPRNVGRAQSAVVSSDSGVALLFNPGGMIRRSQPRLQLSLGLRDDDASFASSQSDSPRIDDLSAPVAAPLLAYHHGNREGTWVVGALALRGASERLFPEAAFGQQAADVTRLFPHRYGGTRFSAKWNRFAFGGALRVGDWLGIGASLSVSQLALVERSRMWAGFDGRDPLFDPENDLRSDLRGRDSVIPGVSLGMLIAPPSVPFEFAVSAELRDGASLKGAGDVQPTSTGFPSAVGAPRVSLKVPSLAIGRSGIRYLGDRFFVEASVQLAFVQAHAPLAWQVSNLEVIDESGATVQVDAIPALAHLRSFASAGLSFDLEIESGFLWLTGGYRWTQGTSPAGQRSPAFARLGGHQVALGLEGTHQGLTLCIGYSRSLERSAASKRSSTERQTFNPFQAGTGPSNVGDLSQSTDQLGFALELSWD